MDKAKKDVYNILLNHIASQYGMDAAIKHISDTHEVPFDEIKKWTNKQFLTFQKQAQDKKYKKIEIHVEDHVEELEQDQKNQKDQKDQKDQKEKTYCDIVLDKKNNLYKRLDALNNVHDIDLLMYLYKKVDNNLIKKHIIKTTNSYEIHNMGLKEKDENLRLEVIKTIHHQLKLKWAVEENTESFKVKLEAIRKMKDPHTLQKIIITEKNFNLRKAALQQIKSASVLETVKNMVENSFFRHIDDRIKALNNHEDHIKNTIKELIKKY